MWKTAIILGMLFCGLTIFGVADATTIYDPWAGNGSGAEKNLFNIYNGLFGTAYSKQVANIDPLTSSPTDPQVQPVTWSKGNWGVNVVVKYAGLAQTLGSTAGGVGDIHTASANGYYFVTESFYASNVFKWYDRTVNGTQDSNSAQFVAIKITPTEINWYNSYVANGETVPYKNENGDVYLIAFEDTPTGDRDFNDLVALVDKLPDHSTPEPATMLLLGSGLIGLAGLARRRFKK
jgi:hypothetical protein